jgi:hypothetical protein
VTYYVPGLGEKDTDKIIRSLMQVHEKTATNETDIATLQAAGYVVGPASATDLALARFDLTTGKLIQNSEITLGDSDGKLTRTAGISLSGTNTNDSAAAGYVGEYTESSIALASAVTLTSGAASNVTSISLTAGDWDVSADVTYSPDATTNFTLAWHSISNTSATQDSTTGGAYNIYRFPAGNVPVAGFNTAGIGPVRKLLSGTTTIYLVAQSTFTIAAMKAFGILRARRVR